VKLPNVLASETTRHALKPKVARERKPRLNLTEVFARKHKAAIQVSQSRKNGLAL
jgi:hypothetical protein